MAGEPTLEQRVRAMEDRFAILDRLYTLSHSIDYAKSDDWVDCFTEDGVQDVWQRGEHRFTLSGRGELARFAAGFKAPPVEYKKVMQTTSRITIEGDAADSLTYFHRSDAVIWGRYVDHLLRQSDGSWRIRERRIELESADPVAIRPTPTR